MKKKEIHFIFIGFTLYFFYSLNIYATVPVEKKNQRMKLRVLTYNVWHGLTPEGFFRFNELEPKGRKEKREAWQFREIQKVDPDLLILQEVNPLMRIHKTPFYKKLAKALNMDFVFQVSGCGIKIFSLGVPLNFFSGLMIMAKKNLSLKKIKGLKLSGPFGECSPFISLQFKEFRYALLASFKVKRFLKPVLVVNTHLHHGREVNQKLKKSLNELVQEGEISSTVYEDLIFQLEAGVRRRRGEIEILMSEIKKLRDQYSFIILAGDFNATSESREIQKILKNHFFYVFQKVRTSDENFTWDEEENPNHRFQRDFKLPLNIRIKDRQVYQKVKKILMSESFGKRKIDYIFLSQSMKESSIEAELFGKGPQEKYGKDVLLGSDHFGVLATIQK